MSQQTAQASQVPKTTKPAHQAEQEVAHQRELGLLQAVAPQAAYRRAQFNRNRLGPTDILALQRTVGNRQVQRIVIQRHENINEPQSTWQTKLTEDASLNRSALDFSLMAEQELHRVVALSQQSRGEINIVQRALDDVTQVPASYQIWKVSLQPGQANQAPDVVPNPPIALEFPDGTRVWRDRDGGPIRHESTLCAGGGRSDLEYMYYSQGQHGNLPALLKTKYAGRRQKWERAHTLGQGTGFESPYALYYAPSYVNQTLQNEGIERLLRNLAQKQRSNARYQMATETQAHLGTRRLARISYWVKVIENGQSHGLLEYTIMVSKIHPIIVTAPALKLATNPVALACMKDVDIPPILMQNVRATLT